MPRPKTLIDLNLLPSSTLEAIFRYLVWYSVGMYFVEEVWLGTEDSLQGPPFFLWSERVVAILFTIEYLLRWKVDNRKKSYPFTLSAIIDFLAIVPFYVGFFVTREHLHLVRTMRILRLLKFFRYSRSLQLLAVAFYRARSHLQALGFAVLVLVLFSHAAIYEAERYVQPDKFGSAFDAIWFSCVSITTVGYGDIAPITPLGRIVTMITFVAGIMIFGTFAAVMNTSFAEMLEENLEEEPAKEEEE